MWKTCILCKCNYNQIQVNGLGTFWFTVWLIWISLSPGQEANTQTALASMQATFSAFRKHSDPGSTFFRRPWHASFFLLTELTAVHLCEIHSTGHDLARQNKNHSTIIAENTHNITSVRIIWGTGLELSWLLDQTWLLLLKSYIFLLSCAARWQKEDST